MRILVAPDSFKDCAPAGAVADALAAGLRRGWPNLSVTTLPLADGGEGTVAALVAATGGRFASAAVTGPRGEPVSARYGWLGDGTTAVIEMSAASGLELLPPTLRDPRVTTTRGTGELLLDALDQGATRLLVGIGGSATNDGGAGLAQALGARLVDDDGQDLGPGGAELARLARIDVGGLEPRLARTELRVACDVDNPLCGERGASAVYGPQKGATPAAVAELDAALGHYAEVIRRDLGRDIRDLPGAGAAGGLGGGLVAFCGAELVRGIDLVLDAVEFDARLVDCDLVITGEGRLDASTLHGKTVVGVARRAAAAGVPVIAVAGGVVGDAAAFHQVGLSATVPLPSGPMTLAEALARGLELLDGAGERIARLLRLGVTYAA